MDPDLELIVCLVLHRPHMEELFITLMCTQQLSKNCDKRGEMHLFINERSYDRI